MGGRPPLRNGEGRIGGRANGEKHHLAGKDEPAGANGRKSYARKGRDEPVRANGRKNHPEVGGTNPPDPIRESVGGTRGPANQSVAQTSRAGAVADRKRRLYRVDALAESLWLRRRSKRRPAMPKGARPAAAKQEEWRGEGEGQGKGGPRGLSGRGGEGGGVRTPGREGGAGAGGERGSGSPEGIVRPVGGAATAGCLGLCGGVYPFLGRHYFLGGRIIPFEGAIIPLGG